jgi:GT2 family glycosyltransferase
MKKTLIITVWNDEARLPALLTALKPALKKDPPEILFVDSASRDGSVALLQAFAAKQKTARILREEKPGYAAALNRGLGEAKGELLFFLDAETIPGADWLVAMEQALAYNDLAVGFTESLLPKGADPYTKVMAGLFKGRSARSASAQGFAFPWGPMCNFGARREWFQKVGAFSLSAGSAYDMDWCWRAILGGAVLTYAPKAKALKARPEGREAVLHHFDAFGQGEAWMHRTYAFLLGHEENPDPLVTANDAYLRLRRFSPLAEVAALQEPLEEVSVAFSGGIRVGYDRPLAACGLKRAAPKTAVGWETGKKELTVFVAGKGITVLPAQPAQLFRAWRGGASQDELEALFRKIFRASTHEAQHGLAELLEALEPATDPIQWRPVEE